jgi:peptide/nickel transport system substrate-binding protein
VKRIVRILVAFVAITAVVLAGCGPAATTPPTTAPPTTAPPTTAPPTTTPTGPEKPQYGGTAIVVNRYDILYFDDISSANVYCWTLGYTNEELLEGDWAKGPAGTGEAEWMLAGTSRIDQKAGCLAESWEIPQQGTVILHIRKGVHYALNTKSEASRLVNGRELTVDDVVFSLNRVFTTKGSYFSTAYPAMSKGAVVTSDKTAGTVTVTCPVSEWVNLITVVPDFLSIVPPEVVNKYGNMQNWQNSVGTGPFILTDFVSSSSATFVKNPNYWMTNPVGPGKGDKLPYLDGVNLLIIPDISTTISAFRTGKLDSLTGRALSEIGTLLNDPSLNILSKRFFYDSPYVLGMRTDMADSPFSKKEVRQAVMLALNLKAVKDQYYIGDAELVIWPVAPPSVEYKDLYVPLDQLPANVQALYKGPDVAASKALLEKAGYPTGFNASVICGPYAAHIDVMSMFNSDLAKVGINLTIDSKDAGVWTARFSARNYGANELIYIGCAGVGTYSRMVNFRGSSSYNTSYVNDPVVEAAYQEMQKYFGIDEAKCMQINRDLMPYLLEQAYVIPVPSPYQYAMWWPWVKNYHGEYSVGYYNFGIVNKYTWQDLSLKKQMTGR